MSVPAVLVRFPVKVCVKAIPKFKEPEVPLIVNPEPLTLPVRVAVPEAFVIETNPVVVNPAMLWTDIVLSIIIGELPAVKVPLFTKLPPKFTWRFPVAIVAPLAIVKGAFELNTLAAFIVMIPVLIVVTPPVAANGEIHSTPAVLDVVVLYCSFEAAPYVGAAETVAVPSIDTVEFTVQFAVVNVLIPELENVKLLNVVADAERVWFPVAPKLTVLVPAVKREPFPFHAVALTPFTFKVEELPFKLPAVRVTTPLMVWLKASPKFKVPPDPFIVSPPLVIFPPKVAIPPVFVIETKPVVLNGAILWVAIVLAMTIDELPAVKVPLLIKFPPKVSWKLLVSKLALLLIINGTEAFKTLAAFKVTFAELLIVTPPLATKGVIHSAPAVLAIVVLYIKLAALP